MNSVSSLDRPFRGIISVGLTIGLALFSSLALLADSAKPNIPKDTELMELFRSHLDAFAKLAAMGLEDANTCSSVSLETLDKEPLSDGRQALAPERRGEYRRLLASIRPDLVMGMDASAMSVSFSYWHGGTGLSIGRSWEKGIAYLPGGPERVGRVVNSLNEPPPEVGVYLMPIEPKWYIIYTDLD
jgi:hypothetical protein